MKPELEGMWKFFITKTLRSVLKEAAVRKLASMLNKSYTKPIIICFAEDLKHQCPFCCYSVSRGEYSVDRCLAPERGRGCFILPYCEMGYDKHVKGKTINPNKYFSTNRKH